MLGEIGILKLAHEVTAQIGQSERLPAHEYPGTCTRSRKSLGGLNQNGGESSVSARVPEMRWLTQCVISFSVMNVTSKTVTLGTASEEDSKTNPNLNGDMKPDFSDLTALGTFDSDEIAAFVEACRPASEKEDSVDWAAKVIESKDEILGQATKGALWTAQDIGEALVNATTLGVPKSWNALARSLGENGLDLPYRKFGSKRYFLLACIGATPEEKASKQELLTALPLKAFKILMVTRSEKNMPELS